METRGKIGMLSTNEKIVEWITLITLIAFAFFLFISAFIPVAVANMFGLMFAAAFIGIIIAQFTVD